MDTKPQEARLFVSGRLCLFGEHTDWAAEFGSHAGYCLVIGTPPNAIAIGILHDHGIDVSFLGWMAGALPVVVVLLLLTYALLRIAFPLREDFLRIEPSAGARTSRRGLIYGTLAALLIGALALQLAWQHRAELLHQFPKLEVVCSYLPCRPEVVHEPDNYRVLQRDIAASHEDDDAV